MIKCPYRAALMAYIIVHGRVIDNHFELEVNGRVLCIIGQSVYIMGLGIASHRAYPFHGCKEVCEKLLTQEELQLLQLQQELT